MKKRLASFIFIHRFPLVCVCLYSWILFFIFKFLIWLSFYLVASFGYTFWIVIIIISVAKSLREHIYNKHSSVWLLLLFWIYIILNIWLYAQAHLHSFELFFLLHSIQISNSTFYVVATSLCFSMPYCY